MGRHSNPVGDSGRPASDTKPTVRSVKVGRFPTHAEPIVRTFSELIGGPAGKYLTPSPQAALVPIGLVTIMLMAAYRRQSMCREFAWKAPDVYFRACYSQLNALEREGIREQDRIVENFLAGTSPGGTAIHHGLMHIISVLRLPESAYFTIAAVLIAGSLIAAVAVLSLIGQRRHGHPWSAMYLALAPTLIVSAFISFVAFAVVACCVALWAWDRDRPVIASLFAGIAAWFAPLITVLWIAILVATWRQHRQSWAMVAIVPILVLWLATQAASLVWGSRGSGLHYGFTNQDPGFGTVWTIPNVMEMSAITPYLKDAQTLSQIVAFLMVCWVVGLAFWAFTSGVTVRVAPLTLAFLVGVAVIQKDLPAQMALLVLPLLAACDLKVRQYLWWVGIEVAYQVTFWWTATAFGGDQKNGSPAFLGVLTAVRILAWLRLAVLGIERTLDPDTPVMGHATQDMTEKSAVS